MNTGIVQKKYINYARDKLLDNKYNIYNPFSYNAVSQASQN